MARDGCVTVEAYPGRYQPATGVMGSDGRETEWVGEAGPAGSFRRRLRGGGAGGLVCRLQQRVRRACAQKEEKQ